MPFFKDRYPQNWKEISRRIRFERAGSRCEAITYDGLRCEARHHKWYHRGEANPEQLFACGSELGWDCSGRDVDELFSAFARYRPVRIVLTCAHLPEAEGTMDCREEVLSSQCQWHHNRLDRPMRILHGKTTRLKRVIAAGQGAFYDMLGIDQE